MADSLAVSIEKIIKHILVTTAVWLGVIFLSLPPSSHQVGCVAH